MQDTVTIEQAPVPPAADSIAPPVRPRKRKIVQEIQASDAPGILVADSDSVRTETVHSRLDTFVDVWQGHELRPVHTSPAPLKDSNPGWMFFILLLSLSVLTYLRVFYRKNFSQIVAACFNINLANQILRDENLLVQRASIMLSVMFSMVVSALLYLVSLHYNWTLAGTGTGFIRFIFLTLIVSAAFTLKFIILRICGYLFNLPREMASYIFAIFLINNLLGIILIPFVALILFSVVSTKVLIVVALVLIAMAYLYRLGRGLMIAGSHVRSSPFYLFLYLCALEFAPLLVLFKLVSSQ